MLTELRKNIKFSLKGERGIRGQIFPFFVLIMVIIIIAVMAFVNVAQVNTQKLSTMNAADAGALAGAAQLASTANSIAVMNSGDNGLWDTYITYQKWTTVLLFEPIEANGRFGLYISNAVSNLITYLRILAASVAAAQQAGAQATTTAFANMQIEEVQTRVGSVTGEQKVPSRFSKWLQDKNFYTQDIIKEYKYGWASHYYNITEDKQMIRQQEDYVNVRVKKPEDNSIVVVPAPIFPQATMYIMYLPPCFEPFCPCCLCGAIAAFTTFPAGISLHAHPPIAAGILAGVLAVATIYDLITQMNIPAIENLLFALAATVAAVTAFLQPIHISTGCGLLNVVLVFYVLPLPFIAEIKTNNTIVGVEVTRFSPTRDLGLWQFKERTVTSGAEAGIYGGSAWNDNYRVQVNRVWDGGGQI